MNIRQAEEIARDASSGAPRWPELHSKAFGWAFKKKADRSVSPDYRRRAADVARSIWDAKGKQSADQAPKQWISGHVSGSYDPNLDQM